MVLAETHSAARTQPFSIGNLRQWRIQTVDVVGRRTGITAQQLSSILADSTELHMVVILFLSIPHYILQDFLTFRVILLCFPLNALFFLWERKSEKQSDYFTTTETAPGHLTSPSHMISCTVWGLQHSHSVGSSICPLEPSPYLGPGKPCDRHGGRCHTI